MADFRRDALAHIEQLHNQGKVPLLVGGTMCISKAYSKGYRHYLKLMQTFELPSKPKQKSWWRVTSAVTAGGPAGGSEN